MAIFTNNKNFQPGLIGPYYGWGSSSGSSCSACSGNKNRYGNNCACSCGSSCCDITTTLELGLTQTIGYDWACELEDSGECKIMNSEWFEVKQASTPISFKNAIKDGLTTSIQISDGAVGGEYKILNKITTESGNQFQKLYCITVTGCVTGQIVTIPGNCCSGQSITGVTYASNVPNKNQCMTPIGQTITTVLEEGLYEIKNFSLNPICSASFTLISGCATLTTSNTTIQLDCNEGIIISGENNSEIDSAILNIMPDSIVHYSIQECPQC